MFSEVGCFACGSLYWPVIRPVKGYDNYILLGPFYRVAWGSSGRVEMPGLAESGLSPALLRTLHDHQRQEKSPADPDQKLTPEERAPTAPAARDLGFLSVISNSIAEYSGKF